MGRHTMSPPRGGWAGAGAGAGRGGEGGGIPQVTALTVLKEQHGFLPDHGGPVELHDVAVIADGLQDTDLLQTKT